LDRSNPVRLRVGLVGAGLVGQAEHAFYLWEERDRFDFCAIADPSAKVRQAVGDRYGLEHRVTRVEDLSGYGLDAVVCAVPDAFHPATVEAALGMGLHVFCEKPLALTLPLCDAIVAARDRAQRVVQVGYMKRFDPAVLRLYELLPERIEDIRLISVEVNDPDQEPFVAHLPMTVPDDLPPELRAEARALTSAQLAEALGRQADDASFRALGAALLSSLVHDVAVIHGLLLRYGVDLPETADQGVHFADGHGAQFGFRLQGGGRVTMQHLTLPGVADYTERISVYCRDRILELLFPSPYLRHFPTRLTLRRTEPGGGLETVVLRPSYEEAFRSELRAFHAAASGEEACQIPPEQARRDVALLIDAGRKAAG
jgi:predicted dehydrogenase